MLERMASDRRPFLANGVNSRSIKEGEEEEDEEEDEEAKTVSFRRFVLTPTLSKDLLSTSM